MSCERREGTDQVDSKVQRARLALFALEFLLLILSYCSSSLSVSVPFPLPKAHSHSMILFSPCFARNILLHLLGILSLLHICAASPALAPKSGIQLRATTNSGSTIWAQAAVDVMKAQRPKLDRNALALYNNRNYFQNASSCDNPPVPDQRYTIGAPCPRANLVSKSLIRISRLLG